MLPQSNKRVVPGATVGRLPAYLQALTELSEAGSRRVASEELASVTGVRSAQLRKDLSYLGTYGVRGVGYDVSQLIDEITAELGLTQDWPVIIVGMGNMGRALAAYGGFGQRGFRIVALADDDPSIVGDSVQGLPVCRLADSLAANERLAIGVITTPADQAQQIADRLVEHGVHSILNFAAIALRVPSTVDVRRVDLSTELQILAFHAQRRDVAKGREGVG